MAGGSKHGEIESVLDLSGLAQHDRVGEGFAYDTVERLRGWAGLSLEDLSAAVAVPLRTLARRKVEGRLESQESDRLLRVARLFRSAVGLFAGDVEAARAWFQRPARALGGKSPLELVSTDAGAREVEALIGRLEHGVVG